MDLVEIFAKIADGEMVECPNCNGFGSSLKEDTETCSQCGGSGVIPKKKK